MYLVHGARPEYNLLTNPMHDLNLLFVLIIKLEEMTAGPILLEEVAQVQSNITLHHGCIASFVVYAMGFSRN